MLFFGVVTTGDSSFWHSGISMGCPLAFWDFDATKLGGGLTYSLSLSVPNYHKLLSGKDSVN